MEVSVNGRIQEIGAERSLNLMCMARSLSGDFIHENGWDAQWRQGTRSLGGAGRAPALAGETSRETMSVKALTAARGGSNWKSLASGGPTVDESLLLTLGMAVWWAGITAVQGTPVFPWYCLLDKSAGSWRSRACGWQVRQDSASWGREGGGAWRAVGFKSGGWSLHTLSSSQWSIVQGKCGRYLLCYLPRVWWELNYFRCWRPPWKFEAFLCSG